MGWVALGWAGPAAQAHGVSESTVSLGWAAAHGAGMAATGVLTGNADSAGRAIGRAAVRARPTARAAVTVGTSRAGRVAAWRWNGWVSGAAGREAGDGSFAAFRGKRVGIIGAWADRTAETQTELTTLTAYHDWPGEMDIGVGGLVRGETWEQAAEGQFVERWTKAMRNLRAFRAGKGTTYLRIAHEFNGDWMAWGVNSKNVATYKKGYRLYASVVRKEFPQARLTWSPNITNHTDLTIDQMWPGDDVVDVIGPDLYDFDPDPTTNESWQKTANVWVNTGTPRGINAWQQYALRKGKPIALPEYGLAAGDDPEWIRKVHGVLVKHAAPRGSSRVAGKFVYDCYFNAEDKFRLLNGPNPKAAAAYAALKWGS